jgi:solute carrier family 12 (potassium/chloride transporter), member 4/6
MTSLTRPNEIIGKFEDTSEKAPLFGTFLGVFVPSILMIFGVIIFLRLGWIVGQIGLSTSLVIISLGSFIAIVTALSISSIATNIQMGKGGVYYLLSRSLGLEVGFAIGLPLYFKQALSIAFCVVGFAESLHDLIPAWPITSIGMTSLTILTGVAYTSLNGALKVQLAIFLAIFASLVSFFLGGEISTDAVNYTPTPPSSLGFWAIFAIFFPAMTGVESSVSLSGSLKNPSKSLPLGTISALLVAYLIYMAIPIFLVQKVPLEVLATNPLIMQDIAWIPSLIIVGIWGATLSSALGGLLGAPRTLQALAEDKVVPGIFGKTYGINNEPKPATFVTFLIALGGVYFGSVNIIAPLLTMIGLICYGVLNFSAGIETLMANPSWRPRFQIHWIISLFGALLCLIVMLMIDPGNALIALSFVSSIYLFAKKRQIQGSWDDLRTGILMFFVRSAVYRLAPGSKSYRSWRPHFLVFSDKPDNQATHLVRLTQAICQSKSFLTVATFSNANEEDRNKQSQLINHRLQGHNVQALVQVNYAKNAFEGMHHMIEHYGLGALRPNTIVFGGIAKPENIVQFTHVVHTAYQRHCNIVIINDKNKANETSSSLNQTNDIHVWWDHGAQASSEFMLVLAYMINQNPAWKKSRICLKVIVSHELLKKQTLEEFQTLSLQKRLPMEIEIFVSPKLNEEVLNFVKAFSPQAALILLSLRTPKEKESLDSYNQYLQSLSNAAKDLPPTALVLGSDRTPLENILK